MKKFLKRGGAVLLIVCLAVCFVVPVPAVTPDNIIKGSACSQNAVRTTEAPVAIVSVDYSTAWGDYIRADSVQNGNDDASRDDLKKIADGLTRRALNAAYVGDSRGWSGNGGGFFVRNNFSDEYSAHFNGIQADASLGEFFVLKIVSPGKGTYTLSVDHAVNDGSAQEVEFFFIPGSKVANDTVSVEFAALIADDTYSAGTANMRHAAYKLSNVVIDTQDEYYYVVVRVNEASEPGAASGNVYLSGFSLIGVTEYTSLSSAIAAATSKFHTVKLTYDHTGNIFVDGCNLDLNGYTVSGNVTVFGGDVMDSTDGNGGIAGILDCGGDNGSYIPLYDAKNQVFRLYYCDKVVTFCSDGEFQNNPYVANADGQKVLAVWFDLVFSNNEAYGLIAGGKTGLQLSATININGVEMDESAYLHDMITDYWAIADHGKADISMYLVFTNFSAASVNGKDGKITVTFHCSVSDTGMESQIDYRPLTYTVTAE